MSFTEIFEQHRNEDILLILTRYDDNGLGMNYTSEAVIGHCKTNLVMNHYWDAYDQII